jgi:hypothetical protein
MKNNKPLRNNESWPGDEREARDANEGSPRRTEGAMIENNASMPDENETVSEEALDPGFDEVPLETDPSNVTDESVYDDLPPEENDPAYFAPTDPVLTTDQHDDIQVLGGWAPSALSPEAQADRSAEGPQPGDEALADAVRRELQEDAMTTDLAIEVEVNDGIVHLRGHVTDLEDAEAAESVASEVPGVREVRDEIDVRSMDS